MKARSLVPFILFLVLAAAGLAVYAWRMTPKLLVTSPQAGAENVLAVSSLRLTFSQSMDQASVSSRLTFEPAVDGTMRWENNTLVFTPARPWSNGTEIQVHLDRGGRAAIWLAFPMGSYSWSFQVGGPALAYLWPSKGPADIYALDTVTGSIRQYTYRMNVLDYTASRDGQWLYFSAGNSQGGADLYTIDRIGAERSTINPYQPEKLLDCGVAQCRNPAVSADGQTLAYEYLLPAPKGGLGPAQVWILRLADLAATSIGKTDHETVLPVWSATGWLAYYDRTSSTYEVYNPLTQQRSQVTNQTGQPGAWSPNGAIFLAPEISYQPSSGSFETGSSHLFSYDVTGNKIENLSGGEAVEDVEAVFSPEGGTIAFTRKFLDAEHWSLGRQVWLMSADGSNAHPITNEPDYNHYDLAWSPDGSRLAYVRFNQAKMSEAPELWMVNSDGGQAVQLVIGGYSPLWIP